MHDSVRDFVRSEVAAHLAPTDDVLECGSLNVNGSIRPLFRRRCRSYLGIDVRPGPGVDFVCDAERSWSLGPFDWVVSVEMLEHAADWRGALWGMVMAARPGGRLVLTARGPGAGRHDHPADHWRFTPDLLGAALERLGMVGYVTRDPGPGYTDGVFFTGTKGPKAPTTLRDRYALADLEAEPAPER